MSQTSRWQDWVAALLTFPDVVFVTDPPPVLIRSWFWLTAFRSSCDVVHTRMTSPSEYLRLHRPRSADRQPGDFIMSRVWQRQLPREPSVADVGGGRRHPGGALDLDDAIRPGEEVPVPVANHDGEARLPTDGRALHRARKAPIRNQERYAQQSWSSADPARPRRHRKSKTIPGRRRPSTEACSRVPPSPVVEASPVPSAAPGPPRTSIPSPLRRLNERVKSARAIQSWWRQHRPASSAAPSGTIDTSTCTRSPTPIRCTSNSAVCDTSDLDQ